MLRTTVRRAEALAFQRDGFVRLRDAALRPELIAPLRERFERLFRGHFETGHPTHTHTQNADAQQQEAAAAKLCVAGNVSLLTPPAALSPTFPLSKIPLSKIPLSKVPLSNIPLSKVPLFKIPLSKIPLSKVPLFLVALSQSCVLQSPALQSPALQNPLSLSSQRHVSTRQASTLMSGTGARAFLATMRRVRSVTGGRFKSTRAFSATSRIAFPHSSASRPS